MRSEEGRVPSLRLGKTLLHHLNVETLLCRQISLISALFS
jgi:hypothetical protein